MIFPFQYLICFILHLREFCHVLINTVKIIVQVESYAENNGVAFKEVFHITRQNNKLFAI